MKILLAKDDQHTSELIAETLLHNHYAVETVADGITGCEMAAQWEYDLIILDVLLPQLDRLEVCRKLRDRGCQSPILFLSAKGSNRDIVTGLDAGADDYLTKPYDLSQLLARVRSLLRQRGTTPLSPILSCGLLRLDPVSVQVSYNRNAIAVRPKEYALLNLFLCNPNQVLSHSRIIDHLWPVEAPPVEGSITNLLKDLQQSLRAAGMLENLIETVYGLGCRLKAAPTNSRSGQNQIADDIDLKVDQQILASTSSVVDCSDRRNQLHRFKVRVQQITERFQQSLEQRTAKLEAVERSLQACNFSLEERQAALTEARKLVGGLGTFGRSQASQIVRTIEHLLELSLQQERTLMNHLPQLLKNLKRKLSHFLTDTTIA